MAELSEKLSALAELLEKLSATRLAEAKTLAENGHHAGAIYVGGYAVECLLKAAICCCLDLDRLPTTFHSHDLEALLVRSGLKRKLERTKRVHENFGMITALWNVEGGDPIRYKNPGEVKEADSRKFIGWLANSNVGVLPWVSNQISKK